MIAVFDPGSVQCTHVVFNAAFLASLHMAFPDEEIIFFGERSHVRLLQDSLDASGVVIPNLKWRTIRFLTGIKNVYCWHTYFTKIHLDCLNKARQLGARRNIFMCVTFPGLLMLKLFTNSIFRNLRLTLVLHSYQYTRASWPAIVRLGKKATLKYGNTENIQYLVLSPIAYLSTTQEFPCLTSKIHWIDHPYLFRRDKKKERLNNYLRFGFIGRGDSPKGFPLFLRMVKEVRKKLQGSRFRADFIGIGHLTQDMYHVDQSGLSIPLGYDPVPREEFERLVSTLDYAVLPYSESFYRQAASGSLMDAISLGKPLMALKIPYFEELFERMGDIGYLFKDYNDMVNIVMNIIENYSKEHYMHQKNNIIRGRSLFEPSTVAKVLRSIIKQTPNSKIVHEFGAGKI